MAARHVWLVDIGNNLKRLRKQGNLSQEQLADVVGVDRTYMGGIERGERNVSALNLIRIASALGVEVGALFSPIATLKDSDRNPADALDASSLFNNANS